MNREEKELLRQIQNDYLEEIRDRERKHTEEILYYRKKVKKRENTIKIILILIALFVFLWSVGYWFLGRDNNTAYVKNNNGKFIQQNINNEKGE